MHSSHVAPVMSFGDVPPDPPSITHELPVTVQDAGKSIWRDMGQNLFFHDVNSREGKRARQDAGGDLRDVAPGIHTDLVERRMIVKDHGYEIAFIFVRLNGSCKIDIGQDISVYDQKRALVQKILTVFDAAAGSKDDGFYPHLNF